MLGWHIAEKQQIQLPKQPKVIISFINFIMASQNNSTSGLSQTFRLQRLAKTIGTREHSQSQYEPKQTFKLAAINSISRGIKYNDLSFMTDRELHKLRKQPEAGEDIQYESAHFNLAGVRKNYDSVHKQKNIRELSITKLKEQKRKLSINQGQLLDNRNKGDKQVKNLDDTLENTRLLSLEAEVQKKVLLNMRQRLKTDKVVYDQRKFDLEKELRFLNKQKQVFVIDKTDISESEDRATKVSRKFMEQTRAEQQEREAHLRNMESMIEQKQRVNQLNEARGREMQDIAQRAMQDKDDNQKNWEKLYMTNKLLSKLLRDKMDRQMNKFLVVETAFKTIKIATGVSDAESLVQKFLNKESAYGDLLGKIAQNEKRIEMLKQESEELRKQYKQLEAEKQIIDSTKKQTQNIESDLKKMTQIQKKQEKSQLYREKMRTWIGKTNKKINSILGKNLSTNVQRDLKSISKFFIQYLTDLSAEIDASNQIELAEEKYSARQATKQDRVLVRIKDKAKDREEQEQQEQQAGDNNEETEIITNQRLEILRSNQKFMKEIKKKHEEKKKVAAEAMSPKKKNEAEKAPVKKVEEED